jgi:DNA-binding PadR family transcriptional regulator
MREGSTGYVVLGILAIGGDLSGYQIRQWVEQAIGFFWSESFGQIYPALKHLAAAKLIKALPQANGGRGARPYRITPAGREALRRWLQRAPKTERPRNELLLKLFFGAVTGSGRAQDFLAEAARGLEGRVRAITAAEQLIIEEDRASPNLVFSLITVMSGRLVYAARLEWVRSSLKLLEAQAQGGNEAVLRAYAKAVRQAPSEG